MNLQPFDLEKALKGEPFGRVEGGKFIKATHIHVLPNWMETEYSIRVRFKDDILDGYPKNNKILFMAPKVLESWLNVYRNSMGDSYVNKREANDRSCVDRLALIHLTYDPATDTCTSEVVKP